MTTAETIPAPPSIPAPAEVTEALTERRMVSIDKVKASPTQQRKAFDQAKLAELAESIKTHGVLQPPLARPRGKNGSTYYELVFGERRLRASKLAGLHEIPLLVRDMTDREVVEVQIIENVQRDDLDPLEEADGYRALHEEHGCQVADLAAKIGKSVAYIYARLKLCDLGPEARKALQEGKLTPSSALLVARVPAALQKEAVAELQPPKDADPLGAREAGRRIQERFMLRLADAPFPKGDPDLVPKAGACNACPKRTGNQPELFGDVKSSDTCTDPNCYAEKRDAQWARDKAKAKEAGKEVLEGKAAKEIFPHGGGYISHQSGYVDLDAKDPYDPKRRTVREKLGKKLEAAPVVIVRAPDAKVHEVIDAKDLKKLLPKPKTEKLDRPKPSAASEADRLKTKANEEGQRAALQIIVKKLETKDLTTGMWRAIVEREVHDDCVGMVGEVLIARGIIDEKENARDADKKVSTAIAKMTVGQLRALYVELRCAEEAEMMLNDSDLLPQFAKEFGLDLKEHVARALARLKFEAKAPKPEAKAEKANPAKKAAKAKKK